MHVFLDFFMDFYGLSLPKTIHVWIFPIGKLGTLSGMPMAQVHLQKEQLEKVSALGKQRFPKLTPGRGIDMDWLSVFPGKNIQVSSYSPKMASANCCFGWQYT